jgi:hypothetical protein
MNAKLFASLLLAAAAVALIILLTVLIVTLTFPDRYGLYRCPRWLPVPWHVRWLEWTKPLRKAAFSIHVAWTYLCESDDPTVVLASKDDWETLEETLSLDAESSAFDEKLREEISAALGNILVFSR